MAAAQTSPQTIVPHFYYLEVEDKEASRIAGMKVMKKEEMVDIRIPGNRYYNPHEPAHAFWKRENGEDITNAMRWPEAYKAFKERGVSGHVSGTPIERLTSLTSVQRSTLKALSVHTVEILASLEGKNLSSLGISANEMKRAAQKYLEATRAAIDIEGVSNKVAEVEQVNAALLQRIKELEAAKDSPVEELTEDQMNDPYFGLTDDDLKEKIKLLAGEKPKGPVKRETLINMLTELEASAEE